MSLQPEAIDEILRLQGPLAANRRTTTCPVVLGGRRIEEGERVTVHWAVANRDARVFDAQRPSVWAAIRPTTCCTVRASMCPGAPLARMELRVALRALLDATEDWACVPDQPFTVAQYPASGYAAVPLRLRWA